MGFQKPTYEEYLKANKFAKFKYKYGIVVMILAWLCLASLAGYMIYNGEAVARHPLIYGAEKYNAQCTCHTENGVFFVDHSSITPLELQILSLKENGINRSNQSIEKSEEASYLN